jgi:hypothetical protein
MKPIELVIVQAVMVNICIRNEETRLLGIDSHICEVQLVLKNFVKVRQVQFI